MVILDRGPWYLQALEKLGIEYLHEIFRERNKVEDGLGSLKIGLGDSTKT
ncbi:MAG: hypothetical protein QXT26_08275 [Thermoproteota archaeon]